MQHDSQRFMAWSTVANLAADLLGLYLNVPDGADLHSFIR